MTWHFWITDGGTTVHAADHTGTEVTDSPWVRSEGWTWSGDYPDEIFSVMQDEAVSAWNTGDVNRAIRILADAAFEDIEHGQP